LFVNRYRQIEHTADLGLEIWGDSRSELFAQAACALREVIVADAPVSPRETQQIEVSGSDDAELLVAWLSELLFLFECRGFLPADCELVFGEGFLRAQIKGEPFDPQRHPLEREVKAITHHQVLVEEKGGQWHARVYVDI
jgi:SHS2 domain-containing protein